LTLIIALSIFESPPRLHSQSGSSLGSVRVLSLTLSCTPKSMKCDSQASLLARTLVSPCLGYKPKARVATMIIIKYKENIIIMHMASHFYSARILI